MSQLISSFDLTNASYINDTQNNNSSYGIGGNFSLSANITTLLTDYPVVITPGQRNGKFIRT